MSRWLALLSVLGLVSCHPAAAPPPFDWCVANQPPDEACFASKRDPSSATVALALTLDQRQQTLAPTTGIDTQWEAAVMMLSFVDLYRVTNDAPTLTFTETWANSIISAGYQISDSDSAGWIGPDVSLRSLTGSLSYQPPIDAFMDYVNNVCLRTPDGGLNQLGASNLIGVTFWVDSLFGLGQAFVRQTLATGDPTGINDMQQQLDVAINDLQDTSGFFQHATPCDFIQDPDVFWGRGNGWVTWALADYLRARMVRGESDSKAQAALVKLAAAEKATQDPATGLWWTVINLPGQTYLETSGSALIAAGLARGWRIGVLGDEYLPVIAKAMAGLQTKIVQSPNGPVVTDISGPTDPGTFADYAGVPVEDDLSYGIGAVVLALIESSGLPAN